jgi:rhizosphere induced protein
MSKTMTLTFYNQSANGGYSVITQSDAALDGSSNAWLKEYVNPDGSVAFTWTTDYAFVWDDSGALVPGVQIKAEQLLPSDLQANNEVTLTFDTTVSSFTFTDQRKGQPDTLTIAVDATIPPNMVSVGFAQSGAPVTVMPARSPSRRGRRSWSGDRSRRWSSPPASTRWMQRSTRTDRGRSIRRISRDFHHRPNSPPRLE